MNQTKLVDDAARLQELADREELTDLIYRLGVSLDEGTFDEMKSILSEDATALTPGGSAEGREAVIAQAARNHSAELRIQHVITNVLVGLRGDRAVIRANLIGTFAPRAGESEARIAPEPQYTVGEIYHFEAVRMSQGWLLSRVEATPVWAVGTRP